MKDARDCPRSLTIEKKQNNTPLDIKMTRFWGWLLYTTASPSTQQLLQTGMHQWIRQSQQAFKQPIETRMIQSGSLQQSWRVVETQIHSFEDGQYMLASYGAQVKLR